MSSKKGAAPKGKQSASPVKGKQPKKPRVKKAAAKVRKIRDANALSRNPAAMAQPVSTGKAMRGAKGTGLSKCAEIYAKALINPFGEFDELPCVPCAPSDLTYKFRTISRGSFQTSTSTGVGFVCWAPRNPTNDINSIFTSDPTFLGSSFATVGTGVNTSTKTLPLANAAFVGSDVGFATGRLVASGIRVKNTTAPLYRQGSVMAVRLPTGSSVVQNAAGLAQSLESVKEEAARAGWFNWNYLPQDQEDLDFKDEAVDYSVSPDAFANFGILVQGGNLGNISSFDYEIVEFWEFVSSNDEEPLPSLTKTHADSVGLDRVLEAVSVPVQSLNLKDQAQHVSLNIVDAMAHSDSAAKTVEDLLGLAGLALPTISSLVGSLSRMLLQ